MDEEELFQMFLGYRDAMRRDLEATKGHDFVNSADLEILQIDSRLSFRQFWAELTRDPGDRELWTRRLESGYEAEKRRVREVIQRSLSARRAA